MPAEPVAPAAVRWPTAPVAATPEDAPERTRFVEPDLPDPVPPSVTAPTEDPYAAQTAALEAAPALEPEPEVESAPEPEADAGAAEAAVPALVAPAADRSGRRVLLPVLAVLVAVLAGLTAFLGVQAVRTDGPDPVDARRTQALASARESARLVFSYDYRRLAKDFAAGKAVTTGEFAKEYERTTTKLVEDVAPRYQAVVSADVSEASVVRASEDEVECLVFVNQSSTSSLATTPKITQSRLVMTLQRKGDRWLVAKIDAL